MLLDRLQFFLGSSLKVKQLSPRAAETVWQLQSQDHTYHQTFQDKVPTLAEIAAEMTLLPEGARQAQKFYIGFYQDGNLVAVMDLVLNYPKVNQVWLGLLMVAKKQQGHGWGQKLMLALFSTLKREGYQVLQLANAQSLDQAQAFFRKIGFTKGAEFAAPTKLGHEIMVDLLIKEL